MEKQKILESMVKFYHSKAYTDNYILGYAYKGVVYAARVDGITAGSLEQITKLDKASSKCGGGYAVKYVPSKRVWDYITSIATDIQVVCSVEYLEQLYSTTKHNRGQIYETLVCDVFNAVQDEITNKSFMDGGDIYIDGIAYQVKYTKATFINEKTLHNMARQ